LEILSELNKAHPDAWNRIHATLSVLSHDAGLQDLAGIAKTFDKLAARDPDAGVALYALGDPKLLETATGEIMDRVREWKLIDRTSVVLDLGCGTGRMTQLLSAECAFVIGMDVSRKMLSRAQGRCDAKKKAFVATSGRDLSAFSCRTFDLVIAVDSFPYIVAAESDLARRHIEESARVLHSGGRLLILNFSYRNDIEADRDDVARYAVASGLEVERSGVRAFSVWDAPAFQLRKS